MSDPNGKILRFPISNYHKHTLLVTYSRPWRRLWRRVWWVRCWECDIQEGPYYSKEDADQAIVIQIASRTAYGAPIWP